MCEECVKSNAILLKCSSLNIYLDSIHRFRFYKLANIDLLSLHQLEVLHVYCKPISYSLGHRSLMHFHSYHEKKNSESYQNQKVNCNGEMAFSLDRVTGNVSEIGQG
jgi:predicted glycosyltransferase involved in capsule biosynthesis